MTDEQKERLQGLFTDYADTLTDEQLQELYFRLDDLIQYGPNALTIVYDTVWELFNERKEYYK